MISMSITSIYGIHPIKIKVIQNMNNNDHIVNEKKIQKIIIINCIVIKFKKNLHAKISNHVSITSR